MTNKYREGGKTRAREGRLGAGGVPPQGRRGVLKTVMRVTNASTVSKLGARDHAQCHNALEQMSRPFALGPQVRFVMPVRREPVGDPLRYGDAGPRKGGDLVRIVGQQANRLKP